MGSLSKQFLKDDCAQSFLNEENICYAIEHLHKVLDRFRAIKQTKKEVDLADNNLKLMTSKMNLFKLMNKKLGQTERIHLKETRKFQRQIRKGRVLFQSKELEMDELSYIPSTTIGFKICEHIEKYDQQMRKGGNWLSQKIFKITTYPSKKISLWRLKNYPDDKLALNILQIFEIISAKFENSFKENYIDKTIEESLLRTKEDVESDIKEIQEELMLGQIDKEMDKEDLIKELIEIRKKLEVKTLSQKSS